ncbi:unnamed protein product [Angiostrongylus costaricensis]|uniref:Glucosidase 2 subunit beta n=1 Tax=Angiostrongylus costaricensis TaxID=334426 RepID=A0A158PLP6_ANGCS|nr:unnamed protein product [Angiostrongylus costaricensis]
MLKTSAYLLLLVVFVVIETKYWKIVGLGRSILIGGPLYKKSSEFVCFDGSKSIKYDHVNDDYCDCPDGSDEPGTSACPNGKFHCANKGHTSADIPSSRVNDKICDCCDGSDEYSGSVECPNICDELGNSAREQKRKQMEIERKGYVARKILAAEGQKLREEKLQGVVPLKEEKAQLLLKKEELLQMKNMAVEKETTLKDKHREVNIVFSNRITLDEIKNLGYLDDNNDGTVSEEEAKSFAEQDFGADYAWATLKGKCFERTEKQYTYKFCPFERVVQIEKSGVGETGLGSVEWSGELPRKYSKQSYRDGQACWNGPQRSTEVDIQCGEDSELIEASEPAKCEYRFVFRTPAACNDPDQEEATHMEL